MSAREWYVSYDVTCRSITLTYVGHDEHPVHPEEAAKLRDDLSAAIVAEHEHSILRGEQA